MSGGDVVLVVEDVGAVSRSPDTWLRRLLRPRVDFDTTEFVLIEQVFGVVGVRDETNLNEHTTDGNGFLGTVFGGVGDTGDELLAVNFGRRGTGDTGHVIASENLFDGYWVGFE